MAADTAACGAEQTRRLVAACRDGHLGTVLRLLQADVVRALRALRALRHSRGVRSSTEALRDAVPHGRTTVLQLLLLPSAVPMPPETLACLDNQGKVRTGAPLTWLRAGAACA